MIRVAICDDSKTHVATIQKYLATMDSLQFECDVFESGEALTAL